MSTLATTKMSSKGQIVIPEIVRKKLNLQAGAQFVVIGEDDVVILKAITTPSMEPFDFLIKQARQQAKAAGLKQGEIRNAIVKAREKA
jgi:AbrB family looped-hinge helix DNA binding protein